MKELKKGKSSRTFEAILVDKPKGILVHLFSKSGGAMMTSADCGAPPEGPLLMDHNTGTAEGQLHQRQVFVDQTPSAAHRIWNSGFITSTFVSWRQGFQHCWGFITQSLLKDQRVCILLPFRMGPNNTCCLDLILFRASTRLSLLLRLLQTRTETGTKGDICLLTSNTHQTKPVVSSARDE